MRGQSVLSEDPTIREGNPAVARCAGKDARAPLGGQGGLVSNLGLATRGLPTRSKSWAKLFSLLDGPTVR